MSKKHYTIKSLSMMNYLVRCGHDCVGADDNEHCKHFKVFLFEDSEQLRADMANFKNTKK